MSINQELHDALCVLREKLKNEGRTLEGRAPIVCTDDALSEIVRLMPSKTTDFSCVDGLGQTFIEKYAEQFLEIISKYTATENSKGKKITAATMHTLKELEKKLVNINRRNRLLYMPKISSKYAYDLYDETNLDSPLHLILGKKPEIIICDARDTMSKKGQSNAEKYKRAVALIREANKDLRDKGHFDLYIGYPFVQGKLAGEDFDVRSPLVLFPVEVEREAQYISLRLDESKDIIYNNNLILAHHKFNGINKPLPNNVIEDIDDTSFINNVIEFYHTEGLEITYKSEGLSKFKDYLATEFPQHPSGELVIDENIVLGKFPTHASALQKDFNDILENDEINDLLGDLLVGMDDIDLYSESATGDEAIGESKLVTVSEKNLTYIGELNGSQENVIAAIQNQSELVVQGPPGTGKSQTITSLISDFANANKCVLMVSEKKSALDVVYSRLGELSKYAIIIDDVNNKAVFYKQIEKMISLQGQNGQGTNEISTISENIDQMVKNLEAIAEQLYAVSSYGIEVYKLYLMNDKYDFTSAQQMGVYKILKETVPAEIINIQYHLVKKIYDRYKDPIVLNNLSKYKGCVETAYWLEHMRENLSEYDVLTFCEAVTNIGIQIDEWKHKNIIGRLLSKSKIEKQAMQLLSQYFKDYKKEYLKLLFDGPVITVPKIQLYNEYILAKPVYYGLNDAEKAYFNTLYQIHGKMNLGFLKTNDELFNFVIFEYLQQFEVTHRELIQSITNFDQIIQTLSLNISQKRKLTKLRLEHILLQSMGHITTSKRSGEISRIIESKRKWSVNKFIRKFDFELFRGIKIWLLTPDVVSEILPLQVGLFDLLIFDEASQMYVEKGVPSIIRGKKIVVAGDSKQLRPSNLGAGRLEYDDEDVDEDYEGSAALEEESLLDLARFKYKQVLLNFHYRSKYEELIAFSNYAFYKGRLFISPNAKKPVTPPIEVHLMTDGLWVDRSNKSEATKIVELLKAFFETRQEKESIGIITFNSNQRDLIEDMIDEACLSDPTFSTLVKAEIARRENGEDIGLFIKNIENVQGDERDVIMFSIGYAKNESGKLIRNFGWLNQKGGENRLNVAISRAKKKIHIVTSFHPSELDVEACKNNGPSYLKKYLEYCAAISSGDQEGAKLVLHSFGDSDTIIQVENDFENRVYDALLDKGFSVEKHVGIGGYSIDLAIKQGDQYILGIECDGKLYQDSQSTRERDFHRQKYLEARGWKIHRIWSSIWWKNPTMEIEKIVSLAESFKP